MVKNDYNFRKNVADSKFLLLLGDDKKVSDHASGAFINNTPVFYNGEIKRSVDKNNRNLILSFRNIMDMASKVIELSRSELDYKNLQQKISKSIQFNTWDEVGKVSLKYIESL
jgi:hypothetical protein